MKYYLDAPTHKDKEKYSNSLFNYTEKKPNTNDSNNDMSDFDVPPPKKKKDKIPNPTSTVSIAPTDGQKTPDKSSEIDNVHKTVMTTFNYMQTYKQNHVHRS